MVRAFVDSEAILAGSFIRHVEIHETLGSTNDRAAELARDPHVKLPALVVAEQQTAGRGRGQNTWWSARGALTFSVLLDTGEIGISVRNWPQLSLAVALAVCDALAMEPRSRAASAGGAERQSIQSVPERRLGIKWPNDIMLDGRKVCGILIESPNTPVGAKDRLIIGIGINVNNSWRSAPHAVETTGISLSDSTSNEHDLNVVLSKTLDAIQTRLSQLATGDADLPAAWQQQSWLTGQRVEVEIGAEMITGVCVGISADGALLVENSAGIHAVRSGSARLEW